MSEAKQINVSDKFHICPVCGYNDGFHTSFKRESVAEVRVILICPECHSRFDVNWLIKLQ